MTDKCRYKQKRKDVVKGKFWCKRLKKVVKDCSCRCFWYRPKFLKSLKELFY